MSERSGYVYAVWQTVNGTNWHVRYSYSTDGGNKWSKSIILGNNFPCVPPGPLPVILAGSPSNSFEVMVAYRRSDLGIQTRRTTTSPGATGWSAPITVAGTNGNSMNPSLSYQPNSYGYFSLTWIESGKVYHAYYYPNTWSNVTFVNSPIYGLVQNDANPSYALTSSPYTQLYDKFIVWQATSSGRDIIIANRNFSSVFQTFEPSSSSTHYYKPSVTGHSYSSASLLWHDSSSAGKDVRKSYYQPESGGWIDPGFVVGTNGFNASTSIANPNGGTAKVVWTEGNASPYVVHVDGPYLSRSVSPDATALESTSFEHRRRVILREADGSFLSVDIGGGALTNGEQVDQLLEFVSVDDTAKYSPEQALLTLQSKPFVFPSQSNGLRVTRSVRTKNVSAFTNQGRIQLELVNPSSGAMIRSFGSLDLKENNGALSVDDTARTIPGSIGSTIVKLRVRVDNLLSSSDARATIINRSIENAGGRQAAPKVQAQLPAAISLAQNYPNPFNPLTTIEYSLPEDGRVTLKVYDILGREVLTLLDEFANAGSYRVQFDAKSLASAVYFYRLQVAGFSMVKKMLLLR